jgi:hypothetical protein
VSILNEEEFRKYLKGREFSIEEIDFAVKAVKEFEECLDEKGTSFESADMDSLKEYLSLLIDENKNSMNRLMAIARYCNFARKNDYYVYFASILNAREVLPSIGQRLASIAGEETRRSVFDGFELPPLGTPPDSYPKLTKMILSRLEVELPAATCREVLAFNYHGVPTEAFKEKKERFEKANSIDEYLREEHKNFVEELTKFMKDRRIWYEQEITPEVVQFVKGNQEIQTGVRHENRIYVTKIPYAPKHYLSEKNPVLKRYYACHCPLARTAIRDGKPRIPPVFCYCSGGFEKLSFDVIFEQPTEIELLESVLKGDARCRFAIMIPQNKMK